MEKLVFLCILALVAFLSAPGEQTAAEAARRVTADVVVTRLAPDRWRVDYTFDTPVSGIAYGRPVASYREQAWHVLTPGTELITVDGREAVVSRKGSLTTLSVVVDRYTDYAPDNYAPCIPFSDGGAALYLGFFTGDAIVDGNEQPVDFRFRFEALASEHVVPPSIGDGSAGTYAYFGVQESVASGKVRLLLDPATPAWLRDAFVHVTQSASRLFSAGLAFDLPAAPLVLVGAGELEGYEGYSVKGGAVGGQLVMLLRGRALKEETEEVRAMFERLTAHELAHLWQLHSLPAGFNGEEPWLHEGAAEAMAVHALGASGLWSPAEVDAFAGAAAERCRKALGGATLSEATQQGNWDAVYACGFDICWSAEADPVSVWSRLAEEAHREGRTYTQATLDRVLAELSSE